MLVRNDRVLLQIQQGVGELLLMERPFWASDGHGMRCKPAAISMA